MKTIKYLAFLLAPCMAMCFTSCTKTTGDAYKKYEKGGEITYPGRADSVQVHAGNGRVQVSVVLGNDPLVTKLRVYYNNMLDSTEVPVTKTVGTDTVNVIIGNLAEGNYNFVIYTYDAKGNKSVPANASGVVYGQSFLNSISNRNLKSVTQAPNGDVVLSWGEPAGGEINTEINYVDLNGAAKTTYLKASETSTDLPSYKDNSTITYRSLFKPDTTAFEFFSLPALSATLPKFERQFIKSNFKSVILPTDVLEGGYGWLEEFLWNENYDTPGFATQNKIPCWFTFDTGTTASLTRFKIWQASDRLYKDQNVKTFELYGSNSPAADGSWESWTKIGAFTSVKPSGLPVGQNSDADIAFAKAGEEFVPTTKPAKFRYYRFKCFTNWGNGSFMAMGELTFYSTDRL
jgi:hypothetical protein